MDAPNRVIVVGAGPVGLCLSLALAQADVQVCLIEALGEDNFLEQVPRAGTNHPATLELLERIRLYDKLEPRGISAPLVHYWARRGNRLIAEGARSIVRKDLDIEFEGFTYPDRTLNIEVAYDFRRHGYTERNYISDPDEWSNLFHWKGPPDRWRIHFPVEPDAQETALTR